ncbi:MAG TPA: dihydroxyacetone kinase subunit DhaK [Candidatus Limnocylindrales bacterium]|jgi:dihydroxyacetone kinase
MQKILNDPERFVDEMLEGIVAAHGSELRRVGERGIVRTSAPTAGRVAIVTGGGSGHLPVFMGYVGRGLLDGAAIGEVFASPSAEQMLEVTEAVSSGSGVLYLYGNYGGDVMNFDLAAELAAASGIEVRSFLAADDVASASPERADRRRGIAGIYLLYKVAGAAADGGASLEEVQAMVARAAAGLRTMGVALSPCTIPAAGRPTFELPDGQMEIGMGIHGEPGVRRGPLEPADRIADELVDALLADRDWPAGSRVAVLVNGLGATPREELYILYRRVAERLADRQLRVHRVWVGEYATSLEMAGASVSLMAVDDDLAALLDHPVATPFVVQA